MRITYNPQRSLFEQFATHELGRELSAISTWLDEHPEVLDLAANDLIRVDAKHVGCNGLTVENVLRCALLKQLRQLSYEELAFHLEDSQSFCAFARLNGKLPRKSCLQKTISLIKPETWEQINRVLLQSASMKRIEEGKTVRIDSTAIGSNIHHPTDSSLLNDSVRVMVRLLNEIKSFDGINGIQFCNRYRRAKNLARCILSSRKKRREKYYRELIRATEETLKYLQKAKKKIMLLDSAPVEVIGWLSRVELFEPLISGVIGQSKRRVLDGEKVPVHEKVLSLFEPHADIISKGDREVTFGHKVNLTTGKSNLILDVVIEKGNPADSERFIPMLKRQADIYNVFPERSATDGGYASLNNLEQAKTLGVIDVVFHKKRGIKIEDMAKSQWVYRQLKNFRAGIEANISCLKRAYGLTRCLWKGFEKFKAYVWSSVVAYNLAVFSRFALSPPR